METLNPLHIFTISTPETFRQTTIKVFRFQYAHCDIYRQYVDAFLHDIDSVKSIEQIPFLPIEFFKTHRVVSSLKQEEVVFVSSGTSTMPTSRHYVVDLGLYEESFYALSGSLWAIPKTSPFYRFCLPIWKEEIPLFCI